MPTLSERQRAYVRKVREIERRFASLENDTVRRIADYLEQLRRELAAQVVLSDGWDAYRTQQLLDAVNQLTVVFQAGAAREVANGIAVAGQNGALFVLEPLAAGGVMVGVGTSPALAQVSTLVDFSVDLIRNISQELNAKITNQIRMAALGQVGPVDVMKAITDILGTQAGQRQTVNGIAYRAEMITRTELNRAFNIANHSQQRAVAEVMPEITKMWAHSGKIVNPRLSHLRLHVETRERPIPVDQPFRIGDIEIMYPGDPAAPAKETVNCGCRTLTVHPDIGVIETPLDRQVVAQLEKRTK